jgi:hypothetical protein
MDAIGGQWPAIRVALIVAGAPDDNLDSGHDRPFRAFGFPYRAVLAAEVAVGRDISNLAGNDIL